MARLVAPSSRLEARRHAVACPGELEPVLPICQKIAKDIRSRYTIGYVPVRTSDKAADRKIRVTATSTENKKLIVRTRTVYRLPERACWRLELSRSRFGAHGSWIVEAPDPLDPATLHQEHGLGLVLMRTLMDEVTRDGTGNEVCLVKNHRKRHEVQQRRPRQLRDRSPL